jgi:GAF domain-containing protein
VVEHRTRDCFEPWWASAWRAASVGAGGADNAVIRADARRTPMLPAPVPADDPQRLQALRELLILDTPPEERFDRIVAFAAAEFDVPIVLVSLVDEKRQWFKARVGLPVCETSREISFCGHAILQDDLFVIEDALRDERFADNPLVRGDPSIRFYVGAPLRLPSGHAVGTLCLIDRRVRDFDGTDRAILRSLRDLVVEQLAGAEGP